MSRPGFEAGTVRSFLMDIGRLLRRSSTDSGQPSAETYHQEERRSLEVSRREMLQAATWLLGGHFLASFGYIPVSDPGASRALDGRRFADLSGRMDGALAQAGAADGRPLPHSSSPVASH